MNKIEIKISHPPEWPTKTIYEACQIVSRGTAPVYVENSTVLAIGQRCVREFGLQPEEARFHDQRSMTRVLKACKGDVLLNSTGTGTIGRSCIFNADGTYIIDGHVTLLRSDPDQLDGRWLNALLQSPQGQLHLETQCYSGSTNQVELSRGRLSATSIPLPSLPEQRRIAEILDTIDEAIEKTEVLISKLKAMKQGLLHDLLTRGLDKNGKLRDPKTHPERFKDSPLGTIPKEWILSRIISVSSIKYGISDAIDQTLIKGVPTITLPCVSPLGALTLDKDLMALTEPGKLSPHDFLQPGDLLFNWRNGSRAHLGKTAYYNGNGEHTHVGFLLRVRTNPQICRSRYLWWLLCFMKAKGFFLAAKGQVNNTFNSHELADVRIILPSINEQMAIDSVLESHEARIRTEEQYRDKLKLQKKGLMHDLLTGKVRVKV